MTEFGYLMLTWAKDRLEMENKPCFTLEDVRHRFPTVCKRKANATLVGSVVAGYLKSSTAKDGSRVYWVQLQSLDCLDFL